MSAARLLLLAVLSLALKLPELVVVDEQRRARAKARALALPLAIDASSTDRPRTRADCIDGPRPCPWVGCAHHLYLDVSPRGRLTLNFPGLEPWELKESCALDLADHHGLTPEHVGEAMGLTAEDVCQIEGRACDKLAHVHALREHAAGDRRVRLTVLQGGSSAPASRRRTG